MTITPMIRSNICLNAHPQGCARDVALQIEYIREKTAQRALHTEKIHAALVLGCSNGFGLASRITASFGYGAATVGVSYEKEGTETKGGTPGWYHNLAFDKAVEKAGVPSFTINGDAFSDAVRCQVIAVAKKMNIKFDLVVYSLASPVRTDPDTGVMYRSVLKPFGEPYSGQTVDPLTGKLSMMHAEPATEDEAVQTVKVMGGEDWQRWMSALEKADVLAKGCVTVAYSYIGPAISHSIYRNGTIGGAKKHLASTARSLDAAMKKTLGGSAYISVNKGLVTRSSAVIPIIPLYLAILMKVMKAKGTHEGCIEQIERLFSERLYTGSPVPLDGEHCIRIDDWEMDEEVQKEVCDRLDRVTEENLPELGDLEGYHHDFLSANGFDVSGIDYEADVERLDTI